MADNEQHRATLQELNRNYIRSVDEADVAWFDANLAPDFFNTNPDGTFIDRKAFVAQIGRDDADTSLPLFRKLSENFELCVTGLGFVRSDLDRMQNPAYRKTRDLLLN